MATQSTRIQEPGTSSQKAYTVTVIASTDFSAAQGVSFTMASELKKGDEALVFNKKNNGMKKTDSYKIEFELDDRTNPRLKLEFPEDKLKAMWVSDASQQDPACPQWEHHNPEFSADSSSKKKLTVINADRNIEKMAFTLRFLKQGDDPDKDANYINYDPIIINENGGFSHR